MCVGKSETYAWEGDEYISKWLEGIVKKPDYMREFAVFFEWLQQRHPELDTPTKLIEKRLSDLKSDNPIEREFFESLVVAFKTYLEDQNWRENTIRGYLRSVRSFFSRNRLPLRFKRGELKIEESLEVRQGKKTKWIISNEELRVVYSMSGPEDRAILLTLYHTGLSPTDMTQLRIENFQDTVGKSRLYDDRGEWVAEDHVYLEKEREKTGIWQKTCLSKEAVYDIGVTLKKRDYPKEGLLLITRNRTPLTVRYLNERLKLLVGQALGEEYGKEFQASDLRDTYNDALGKAMVHQGLPPEIKDMLFGHKREGAKESYHISESTIKEAYEKVFPYLSIDSVRRSKEDITRTNIRVEELEGTAKALKGAMEEFKSGMDTLREALTLIMTEKLRDKGIMDMDIEPEPDLKTLMKIYKRSLA